MGVSSQFQKNIMTRSFKSLLLFQIFTMGILIHLTPLAPFSSWEKMIPTHCLISRKIISLESHLKSYQIIPLIGGLQQRIFQTPKIGLRSGKMDRSKQLTPSTIVKHTIAL